MPAYFKGIYVLPVVGSFQTLLRTLQECLCEPPKSCRPVLWTELKACWISGSCPTPTHPVLETMASPSWEALPELSSSNRQH